MEAGAMCYMMLKQGYGGGSAPHWPSYVMFFYSGIDPASWGGNLPDSPLMAVSDDREKLTEFVIGVQRWVRRNGGSLRRQITPRKIQN